MKHSGELLMLRALHRQAERKPPKLAVVLVDMNYPKEDMKPLRGTADDSIRIQCEILLASRRLGIPRTLLEDARVVRSTYREIKDAAGTGAQRFMKWDNSGFRGGHLQEFLESEGANTLVLMGYEMGICVRETAEDALRLGYGIITSAETLLYCNGGKHRELKTLGEGVAFYRRNSAYYGSGAEIIAAMERIAAEAATN